MKDKEIKELILKETNIVKANELSKQIKVLDDEIINHICNLNGRRKRLG